MPCAVGSGPNDQLPDASLKFHCVCTVLVFAVNSVFVELWIYDNPLLNRPGSNIVQGLRCVGWIIFAVCMQLSMFTSIQIRDPHGPGFYPAPAAGRSHEIHPKLACLQGFYVAIISAVNFYPHTQGHIESFWYAGLMLPDDKQHFLFKTITPHRIK